MRLLAIWKGHSKFPLVITNYRPSFIAWFRVDISRSMHSISRLGNSSHTIRHLSFSQSFLLAQMKPQKINSVAGNLWRFRCLHNVGNSLEQDFHSISLTRSHDYIIALEPLLQTHPAKIKRAIFIPSLLQEIDVI